MSGFAICSDYYIPIPYSHWDYTYVVESIYERASNRLRVSTGTNRSEYKQCYITLEYTK